MDGLNEVRTRSSDFALLMKEIKKEYNLPFIKIYNVIGITRQSVYRYETGELIPPIPMIKRLKEVFYLEEEPMRSIYERLLVSSENNKIKKLQRRTNKKVGKVASTLHDIRVNNLLYQSEIGDVLNMSAPCWLFLESGDVRIGAETIRLMCEKLEVTKEQEEILWQDILDQCNEKIEKIKKKHPERDLIFAEIFTRSRLMSGECQNVYSDDLFIITSYYTSLESGRLLPSIGVLLSFIDKKELTERDRKVLEFYIAYCSIDGRPFSELMQKVCIDRGITTAKVIKEVFSSKNSYMRHFNGEVSITVATLTKLLKAVDISIDECLEL